MTWRSVAGVVLALGAVAGCGRKADPMPPLIEVPETTTDLRVFQEGNEAVLEWSYPQLTRAGRQLTDLGRIEVWRLEVPPGHDQPAAGPAGEELRRQLMLARGRLLVRLEGDLLEQVSRGDRLQVRDQLSLPGPGGTPSTWWYAVRSRRRDGTPSGLSNVVSWQAQPIPLAVTGLAATLSEEGVTLTWEPVEGAGYVVERQAADALIWEIIAPVGMLQPHFLDAGAEPGKTWRYRVRTLVGSAVTPPGAPLEVVYDDIYPPPAPTAIICLPEQERVRLAWDRVPEPGVTYTVFRRVDGRGGWLQLVRRRDVTEHVDDEPPHGSLEYGVKAVDRAGNESDAVYCSVRVGP